MPVSLQNNLSELDTLLADLNSAKYRVEQDTRTVSGSVSASYAYGDYYSDLDSVADDKAPDRPPPPSTYEPKKRSKGKPNVPDPHLLYPPDATSRTRSPDGSQSRPRSASEKSRAGSTSPLPSIVTRKPRKPPKLMHILKDGEKRKVHDLAKENREDFFMDIDVPDEADYGDYTNRWEYKGVSDYGSVSNYSTMKREDYDYSTLSKSPVPVLSEDELEKSTGAGPRGERSKLIPTDHGEVKSKYTYLGFGLWENSDPTPRPKPKKPSPPPPPPKAEPVWYNCTVSVATTLSSKELDDLNMKDMFTDLPRREVEVGDGIGDLGAGIGEPFEMFEKEDMSDMFRRAAFEKMNLFDDDNRKKYDCSVCHEGINGRIITAMARKFHPKCFVCSYCKQGFKSRKFKSDPQDGTPYCYECFEKLLGHYGDAHEIHGV